MKVLFATNNPAKVLKYKKMLEEKGIELITIKDLDFKLDIVESGKDALENAYIKAKAYYDVLHIPTVGMDINLFIDGVPEDKQPGTHVRRVNGKELTDKEMIEYYTNLVKEYGDKLSAEWVCGMVMCSEKGKSELLWSNNHFYFVDKPSDKIIPGYPLDSISVVPGLGKYLVEISDTESQKDNIDGVVEFIINNVK